MAAGAQHEGWMQAAIAAARQGMAAGQSPFGCVIVAGEEALATAHNQVWAAGDPTAHAEVTAIRLAARRRRSISLAGCTLYSTCEPCAMCMAAIHWARIERVIYGAGIADAAAAGFHELTLPAARLVELGHSPVQLAGGCLAAQCRTLFAEWRAAGKSSAY
jgi:guanine deaminase